MFARLRGTTTALLTDIRRLFRRWQSGRRAKTVALPTERVPEARPAATYRPLQRIVLTDGVNRTLFDEYAAHRKEEQGDKETGWVLLGLRHEDEVTVLATLPAGARSEASVTHVRFNAAAQVLGSRIIRQADRRLSTVGIVHTHPGSLRHPSDGDYQGDSQWVQRLRGQEGVFGIGTAGAAWNEPVSYAHQPRPNVQCLDEMLLSWYALRRGDVAYRPVPVALTLGPDLARPLHGVWHEIEEHALELERLFRQQRGIGFEVLQSPEKPGLIIKVPVAEPEGAIQVVIKDEICRYYVVRDGEVLQADCDEKRVDHGVYLLLAELARNAGAVREQFC